MRLASKVASLFFGGGGWQGSGGGAPKLAVVDFITGREVGAGRVGWSSRSRSQTQAKMNS